MWPDDAVRFVADVPLEEPERGVRPGAVESVFLAAVETEGVQHPLELANVVASEHGGAVIQRAIAELPSGLDELLPGVGSDEAVDPKVTLPLEPRTAASVEGPNVPSRSASSTTAPSDSQPRLDVRDLRTSIAHAIDAHRSESALIRDAAATAAAPVWGSGPTPGADRGRAGSRPWDARR